MRTKQIISLIAAMGIFTIALGQTMEASTYIERTHISPKVGSAVGVHFKNNFEVGGFYQQSTVELQAEPGRPLMYENQFYGLYLGCPIKNTDYFDLKVNIRTGVSNNENFVITPSVMGSVKLLRKISLTGGIGTRSLRPTYMASLSMHI